MEQSMAREYLPSRVSDTTGMAQDLLGCEAVSDTESLDCLPGIVTNYLNGYFFKSFEDHRAGGGYSIFR